MQLVCRMIEKEGLSIVRRKVLRLSLREAEKFYEEHNGNHVVLQYHKQIHRCIKVKIFVGADWLKH